MVFSNLVRRVDCKNNFNEGERERIGGTCNCYQKLKWEKYFARKGSKNEPENSRHIQCSNWIRTKSMIRMILAVKWYLFWHQLLHWMCIILRNDAAKIPSSVESAWQNVFTFSTFHIEERTHHIFISNKWNMNEKQREKKTVSTKYRNNKENWIYGKLFWISYLFLICILDLSVRLCGECSLIPDFSHVCTFQHISSRF